MIQPMIQPLEALSVVDNEAARVLGKITTRTFFFGLTNLLLSAYLIGAYPESFWIVYATQGLLILGYRFYVDVTKKKFIDIFHWFDFCWVANVVLSVLATVLLLQVVDAQYMHSGLIPNSNIAKNFPQVGRIFCLFATGPLGWSIIALGNALVLHDIEHYSGCFIHMWPCLTTLSIRWNPSLVIARYPGFFESLSGFQNINPPSFMSLVQLGMSCYAFWWFPFTLWMMLSGRFHSPKETGKTTVYLNLVLTNRHCRLVVGIPDIPTAKDGSSKENSKMMKEEEIIQHAKEGSAVLRYMFVHCFLVFLSMCFSALCYQHQKLHLCFCVVIIIVSLLNASQRYKWMLTKRYVRAMEKFVLNKFPELKDDIQQRHKSKKR